MKLIKRFIAIEKKINQVNLIVEANNVAVFFSTKTTGSLASENKIISTVKKLWFNISRISIFIHLGLW